MDVIRTERAFLKSERRNIFVERGISEMPVERAARIGSVHAAICLAGLRFAKPASQRAALRSRRSELRIPAVDRRSRSPKFGSPKK